MYTYEWDIYMYSAVWWTTSVIATLFLNDLKYTFDISVLLFFVSCQLTYTIYTVALLLLLVQRIWLLLAPLPRSKWSCESPLNTNQLHVDKWEQRIFLSCFCCTILTMRPESCPISILFLNPANLFDSKIRSCCVHLLSPKAAFSSRGVFVSVSMWEHFFVCALLCLNAVLGVRVHLCEPTCVIDLSQLLW